MTIDHRFKDEKLQYNITGEATKTLELLSGNIDKYEYHTSEEKLPSNQR